MIPFAILEICTNKMIGNLRSYYDSVTGHIFERVPLYVHSVDHMRSPQKIVAIALHMQQELPPTPSLKCLLFLLFGNTIALILLSVAYHTLIITQIQTRLFTFMTPIACCYFLY